MSRVSVLAGGLFLLLGGCGALGGPKTVVQVYAPVSKITADPSWPAADWASTPKPRFDRLDEVNDGVLVLLVWRRMKSG